MVETRRLVKTGADTYTISLPKDWVKANKLQKGAVLFVDEQGNKVSISPSQTEEKKQEKIFTINIDDNSTNSVRRQTIAAYMKNYTDFVFTGKTLNKKLNDVRQILNNFLALEIVEQTDTKLVAKDFLNLQEFSTPNTLRRMDMLTRGILEDAKKGKKNQESLEFRDYEVDKLFFLMSRLTRSILERPTSEKDNVEAHFSWWMAKNLERIADTGKEIGLVVEKEDPLYDKILNYYRECIASFFKKDAALADKLIEQRIELLKECDNVADKKLEYRYKEIVKASRNIAKIVLDN